MMKAWRAFGSLLLLAVAASAGAQGVQDVETDPIECWWRSSAGAVKVGEPFTVVLTCSVVETDTVKVVPDQSTLDQTVVQLPPFEVIGGAHPADLRTGDRRFFQYEYRLRVIADDVFGKDLKVPEVKIAYRVQSQVGVASNAALEGRETIYLLRALPIRVVSMVAADGTDIRDATTETFADMDARRFRANLLVTIAGVLFALAAIALVVAVVHLISQRLAPAQTARQPLSDSSVLRGAARELRAIRRERGTGWTSALSGRLATVLRVAASYALGHRVNQMAVAPGEQRGLEGQLVIRGGWTRGTRVVVSGTVTANAIAQALAGSSRGASISGRRVELLRALEPPLARLTLSQYGPDAAIDDAAIDQAFDAARPAVRRLTLEHTWLYRKLAALGRTGADLSQRVWSR